MSSALSASSANKRSGGRDWVAGQFEVLRGALLEPARVTGSCRTAVFARGGRSTPGSGRDVRSRGM